MYAVQQYNNNSSYGSISYHRLAWCVNEQAPRCRAVPFHHRCQIQELLAVDSYGRTQNSGVLSIIFSLHFVLRTFSIPPSPVQAVRE